MLLKIIWKLVLPFALTFGLIVGVPLLHPYNAEPLRVLIAPPESCAAPCWAGIRPGVTSLQDGMAALASTGWAEGITANINPESGTGVVEWSWSGAQPAWIDGHKRGGMAVHDGVIADIGFATRLTLGDFRLALGTPDRMSEISGGFAGGTSTRLLEADYEALNLSVRVRTEVRAGLRWKYPIYYTLYGSSPMG
jgi:hypothetical protein